MNINIKTKELFLLLLLGFLPFLITAQDRNISINEVYPSDMFIENGGRIINVKTSLTYLGIGPNAIGNGINDDSDEIIAAMDWVMNQLKAWFEGGGNVHWHKYYIIYFPDGVYKVSKPLVYSGSRVIDPLYPNATNREGTEKLMLVGQSRENTIIKLVDNATGFGSTYGKPVVSFSKFDLGTIFNNMPAKMQFRNFTINTGAGNPGATGVDFYGANVARLDNIKVVGSGKIGVHIRIGSAHGYYSNIVVEGMDYGLYIEGNEESHPAVEYLTLKNQNINAIYLKGMSVTMRKVESTNSVNGARLVSNGSKLPHLAIVDGSFAGGNSANTAFQIDAGFLYSRNINVHGYGSAVRKQSAVVRAGSIDEYVSGDITTFSSTRVRSTALKSMNLPIEEYPNVPWISDFSHWANVNNYPGETAAEKIQNAMNSGKKVVYFPDNEYTIGSTVNIPASVEQIIGTYSYLSGSGALFNVNSSSPNLLLFNGVNMNSGYIRQTAHRNLLLETTTSGAAPYDSDLTSQGTKVFVNNAHGLLRGSGQSNNVKMWIRYNNNEKADNWQFTADPGSQIVMLGFKAEKTYSVFRILDGAMFEVIGGVLNRYGSQPSALQVGILNQNGHTSLVMTSNGPNRNWSPMINDVQGSESKIWQMSHFPNRGWDGNIVLPLYASYNPAIISNQGNIPLTGSKETSKTTPKSVTFPVKISKNKRYFTDSNNRPFFYQACTGWELLSKLTREETEMYLKNRAEKGFNTIQVTLLPWEVDQVNRYGEPAFIDKKPFGQPNEKYFGHIDWVLQKAKELGIQLGINVFWLRNNWRDYTTVENAKTYGEYIAKRFLQHDNIMWFVGGDINPLEKIEAQQALAETIHLFDNRHLLSYHGGRYSDGSSTSSSALFHREPWHDYNMGYCYDPFHCPRIDPYAHVQFIHSWNLKPVKPVILGESFYEDLANYTFKNNDEQLYAVRRNPLWAITCGAKGHAVGHSKIYPFKEGWQKALDDPNSIMVKNLTRLMGEIQWWTLVPDQYHEVGINGFGNFGGEHYISLAYDPKGKLALAYFPNKGKLTVDMSKFSGKTKARWIDPASGTEVPVTNDLPAKGTYIFSTPGVKTDGYNDYLLVIETI